MNNGTNALLTRAILTNNNPIASQGVFATAIPVAFLGQLAIITDSTVNTWGAAVTVGGGAFTVLCWFNGTQFTVIGI